MCQAGAPRSFTWWISRSVSKIIVIVWQGKILTRNLGKAVSAGNVIAVRVELNKFHPTSECAVALLFLPDLLFSLSNPDNPDQET